MAATLCTSTHLLVISLVLSQQLLPHFLLSFVDIRIELVAILFNGEFLIVVNWNEDFLRAYWLFLGVVELSYVWVL